MQEFVVVRNGNERELISRAFELGWSSIVLLYPYVKNIVLPKFSEENVFVGVFLDTNVVGRDFSSYSVVVALGTSFEKLPKGVTHVVMNEFEKEKDFIHQRRSGLNHVFLKDFKGKILFSYTLQNSALSVLKTEQLSGFNKQSAGFCSPSAVIGRMMQNVKLCRKYKVDYSLVSFASEKISLRAVGDVNSFLRVLEKKSF